ncbi:hypothetical protein RDI58_029223 [Solanum bulbocastanum]|uniref:Endonuclease/exonuclease/phosphatase domain-containing protein n=1 Tax=Solanum bulbocastanum TaxID=147425 RepID=A0AAN8SPZ7_SOLBU
MIEKTCFWNIRSVNTQESFERLMDLKRRHHYSYIALMEPFQGPYDLDKYKSRLGMDKAMANYSSKIWVFWNADWEAEVISDSYQQISIKFKHGRLQRDFVILAVNAKCCALERLELWENLEYVAEGINHPWLVGGDFNVILDE